MFVLIIVAPEMDEEKINESELHGNNIFYDMQ